MPVRWTIKLLVFATFVAFAAITVSVTLVNYAGDVPVDGHLLVPLSRIVGAIYVTLAAIPMVLSHLKLTTLRTGVSCGILFLATVAALNAYFGDPGPLYCPSGHCPDPGTVEYIHAQAAQARDDPLGASITFVTIAVPCFVALGLALVLDGLLSKVASGH